MIVPCYCQAAKMVNKGIEIKAVKIENPNNTLAGCIIERRHELDELGRWHIKSVVHCDRCLNPHISFST